ncbi:hypothetical protein KSZ_06710 [Dictyobacter formicarum]|uniref:Uncharacterized protein n=1 Tax=Dictyobacter formicarum TaxID=2778368 RepID=A0ABQ3VA48_9CHLR|nr:hypothetical protein KSZ_06710 [Dictyobacter formicarum]
MGIKLHGTTLTGWCHTVFLSFRYEIPYRSRRANTCSQIWSTVPINAYGDANICASVTPAPKA